jgi:hypothetical protein
LDLPVDATVVLNDSNRLVVRLMPCDVVARVTPPQALAPVTARASWLSGEAYRARLATEVEVVKRLAENDSPVAGLDPRAEPRVFVHDGFAITMWTCFAPVRRLLPPAGYAQALECLHAGLRQIDVPAPHFTDRGAATQQDVASRDVTPDLAGTDRALLANTLRDLGETIVNRRAAEQVLHGEPHPGNVISTKNGPLFTDFEDSVHGPVEFDLARVPEEVSERYPDADQALVGEFRGGRTGDNRSAPLESRRPAPERETIRRGIPQRSARGSALASARCRVTLPLRSYSPPSSSQAPTSS